MNKSRKGEADRKDEAIVWTYADPSELAKFDPTTRQCVMNCGPHRKDPRSDKERLFLCPECIPVLHEQSGQKFRP